MKINPEIAVYRLEVYEKNIFSKVINDIFTGKIKAGRYANLVKIEKDKGGKAKWTIPNKSNPTKTTT